MVDKKKDHALELLKGAYALDTPDDNRVYYKGFAPYYDSVFVETLGYVYPKAVAEILTAKFQIEGVICDIGCGTGLVAEEIKKINESALVDGVDISKEMIEISRKKNLYRNLYEIDLKGSLINLPKNYAAIVSAGTFTHGHLGSNVMEKLVKHLKSETCVVVGINFKHYIEKGFEILFKNLTKEKIITDFHESESKVYYKDEDLIENNNNKACICSFKIV